MNAATIGPDAHELRDLCVEAAQSAADLVLDQRQGELVTEAKTSGSDLVTAVDRAAEALIVETILGRRPDDGLLGEEGTSRPGTSGVRWIIDPIDGTTNFVLGHPGYSVSIAAEIGDRVVAGAVADPVHGDLYEAVLGDGARCNGHPMRVRATERVERAIVATGFSYLAHRRRNQAQVLTTVLPEIADIRRMGSAALDLCSVGVGRVDAYYEIGLNEWDLAAGALIASEAGATVRRRTITEVDPRHPDGPPLLVPLIVASTPPIADAIDELLRRAGVR
ncbi:MAG: inositol monophosphatase family protein [Acidimicrobiales bacterium]